MDSRPRSPLAAGSLAFVLVLAFSFALVAVLPGRARAHVDYVTDPPAATIDALAFLGDVLSDPVNAALVGGGAVTVLVLVAVDLRVRPAIPDVAALRDALGEYDEYVP